MNFLLFNIILMLQEVEGIKIQLQTGSLNAVAFYQTFSEVVNSTLDISLIAGYYVTLSELCLRNCVKHNECMSYNIGPRDNGIRECHLLNTTKYENISKLVPRDGWTHYTMLNEECEKGLCENNQACIPNYETGTGECLCNSYSGSYCQIKGVEEKLTGSVMFNLNEDSGYDLPAELAIDGKWSQDYYDESCAYRHSNIPSWWRMDFGTPALISNAKLNGRNIEPVFHLVYQVYVGNTAHDALQNAKCAPLPTTTNAQVDKVCAGEELIGRYFFVYQSQTVSSGFCICEIEVRGILIEATDEEEC